MVKRLSDGLVDVGVLVSNLSIGSNGLLSLVTRDRHFGIGCRLGAR